MSPVRMTSSACLPDQVATALAASVAGVGTPRNGTGFVEPWARVVTRVADSPIETRREVLLQELNAIPGIDSTQAIEDIFACDPLNDLTPDNHHAELPAVAAFPVDALPRAVSDFVSEGAAMINCPPDYIAVPVLTALSAAIGTTVRLEIKKDWYLFPSLYTAIVARSGGKKSPAVDYALQFVNAKSQEYDRIHQRKLEEFERLNAEYQAAKTARRKSKASDDTPELPEKPKRPTLTRLTINDATVEAIGKLLAENPRGLLLHREELAGVFLSLNQYRAGRGGDEQFYLSIWDSQRTTIDRKSDEDPTILNQPFLSITGGIQPALVSKILGGDHIYNGFTPRFLFADPVPLPYTDSDAEVSERTLDCMRRVFQAVWAIQYQDPFSVPATPHLVRLTRDARQRFKEWSSDLQTQIAVLAEDDPFSAPLSKMPGYLGRLALILHVIKWAEHSTAKFDDVDAETMDEAIQLADYFLSHLRRVWYRLVESPENMKLRQLHAWLTKQKGPRTVRQIMQSGVAGFKRSSEVHDMVGRMEECGLVIREQQGKTESIRVCARLEGVR